MTSINKMKNKNLLYVSLVFVVSTLIWLLLNNHFSDSYSRDDHIKRALIIFTTTVPAMLVWWRFFDKDTSDLEIIPTKNRLKLLSLGATSWLVPALSGILFLLLTNIVQLQTKISTTETISSVFILGILVFIYEAFPEELIFRGYIYSKLSKVLSAQKTIVIQAILFALWGFLNGGPNSLERTALFLVVGFILGQLRHLTGSMWAGIGFHLAFQTIAQLFGTVGGEFSIVRADILMIVAFVILPTLLSIPIYNRLKTIF